MSNPDLNEGHQEGYDAATSNADKIRELEAQIANNLTAIATCSALLERTDSSHPKRTQWEQTITEKTAANERLQNRINQLQASGAL